jgi:transposase-like protein
MSQTLTEREQKGFEISQNRHMLKRINSTHYRVRSQTSKFYYDINRNGLTWTCTCPDHVYRHVICKHVYSVQFSLQMRQQVKISKPVFYQQQENVLCCPKCQSIKFKKDGNRYTKFGKVQRLSCLVCHYKFSYREGFEGMKQDAKVITLCMDLYFKGISFRQIRDHLMQFYGVKVWQSTIYYWVKRYIEVMKTYVSQFTPNVSGVWHIDETVVNVRGSRMNGRGNFDWLWNLMDHDTRFILSSQIHKTRFTDDARQVLQEGKKNAKRLPAIVVSDSLRAYDTAMKKEIKHGANPQPIHLKVSPIKEGMQNMPIERWHNTLKQRTKVMRGMHDSSTAQNMADAFALYYNFIRTHSSLGMTPAEKADINLKLGENRWSDLIKKASRR